MWYYLKLECSLTCLWKNTVFSVPKYSVHPIYKWTKILDAQFYWLSSAEGMVKDMEKRTREMCKLWK
jgi:hypothetical protein